MGKKLILVKSTNECVKLPGECSVLLPIYGDRASTMTAVQVLTAKTQPGIKQYLLTSEMSPWGIGTHNG